MRDNSFFSKLQDFFERLLALKVTEAERAEFAHYGIFEDGGASHRPTTVALVLAFLLHLAIFLPWPFFGNQVFVPTEQVLMLKRLAPPAAALGGGEKPKAAPPKPIETVPKPKPIRVPIPDPTPNQPEPIRKTQVEDTPQIVDQISEDLNIGDINAPPGPPGKGGSGVAMAGGTGTGPLEGSGAGTGGTGVYMMGSDISDPVILVKTMPSYTDDAIKAKVQGVVLLQAIIRKNGRVDSFKVLRGLGHGLEEKAIQEIASNWKFRPGTKDGRPVDVLATIEVTFNLR